ncbi:MAG: inositol monophosphatase family protein [Gammaproteobacteria bacterium]|nr:inositol monophosphatase family protein [Gammaproteobacteria bacterium]
MKREVTVGFGEADLEALQRLVVDVSTRELMPRYHHSKVSVKRDGSLVTDADTAIQGLLQERLSSIWPDIPLLGEEMSEQEQLALLRSDRFWCLDPLDGTTNFSTGLPYFAISLALVVEGESILGLVYDPVHDEMFLGVRDGGARLNNRPLTIVPYTRQLNESVAMVDLKRLPHLLLQNIAEKAPYRSQRSFGAVALEWCWLAAGRCQLYLHGGQRLWDYAAGSLIFSESGGSGGVSRGEAGPGLRGLSLSSGVAVAAESDQLLQQWWQWLERSGI